MTDIVVLHPRSKVFGTQLPTTNAGNPRAKLQLDRPYLTGHYTGGGLWLDRDDTVGEIQAIQRNALATGKSWEYNYVIDGQGGIYVYAGEYQAAHSAGENSIAIGVLLLIGLKDHIALTGFETPPPIMIEAFRWLRWYLQEIQQLSTSHLPRQHRQMPGAATICPGAEVIPRWEQFLVPWLPTPVPPTNPPTTTKGDNDMSDMNLIKNVGDNKVWGQVSVRGKRRLIHLTPGDFNEAVLDGAGPVTEVADVFTYGSPLGHLG